MQNQVSGDDRWNRTTRAAPSTRKLAAEDAPPPPAAADGATPAPSRPGSPPPAVMPPRPDTVVPRVVIVLGMSETGLGALRLLGSRGARCWGVDAPLDLPGFRSRHCNRRIQVPTELSSSELAAILRCAVHGTDERPVVLPTADRFVKLLSDARDDLRDRFDLALPRREVIDDLLDKRRFADLAARADVKVPATAHAPDLAAVPEAARRVGYPAIVKPCLPCELERASFPKAVVVHTPGEARALRDAHRSASLADGLVVQEYIPGGDAAHVSVAMALDATSKSVATFVSRKRRQGNGGAGVGTFVESHRDDEAAAMARRLLERSGYVGVAEMEMKRHGRTGELHAIEVNPRVWSQVTLPAVLGINFALWYCRIAIGAACAEESHAAPVPCAWQDLWGDLYWTFGRDGYWRHGEVTLREWLGQTLASRAHAYFAWTDPAPGIRRAWDGIAGAVLGGARP